jgi:4-hydroxy-tetrahydrodipicolinate synthase
VVFERGGEGVKWRSAPETIRGSIAPIVTPFTADGEVDHDGLRRLVEFQLENGSHGISLGGSTGEPSSQSAAERISAMQVVTEAIAGRVPFLPGTGSAKLDETLEVTAAARDLGADAALVITPYYSRPTQEGLYQWYGTVAREFPDLPIVIYNVPVRTAIDVAPETVARLRRDFDNVVGIKETTRDFEHYSKTFYACGRDVLMWSGIELLCLPLLTLGGLGFISAVANIAPGAVARMYDASAAGEHDEALDLHYRLHPLTDLIFVETNPAPIKWVMEQLGLITSYVRPPLVPLTEKGAVRVAELLHEGQDLVPGLQASQAIA